MNEFLISIGVKASSLIAGLSGGIISLTYEDKITPYRAAMLIITGGICASYLTPIVIDWANKIATVGDHAENGGAFIIGLLSMKIVGGLLKLGEKFKRNPEKFIKKSR